MSNKLTLLIDGNWLCQSRTAVMMDGFLKENTEEHKQQSQSELKDLLAKSINVMLNRFPTITNIVLVADGGSWRKQLPIPKSLEDIVYKGNRTQTNEIDWQYIYGALRNLTDMCKGLGITVSQHPNIEGDDWIWYWSRRLNAEDTNCLIWSSDNDLKQLVQVDQKTHAFTAWYNDKNGLWLPDFLQQNTDDIDFFFKFEYFSPVLESLKTPSKSTNYINPDSIITSKVICGDAGDNIMSVFRYQKNGRNYRITEKEWGKIAIEYNIDTITSLLQHTTAVADAISSQSKYRIYTPDRDQIEEMIRYNIKLVWLNEYSIPDTIIQLMNQQEYKSFDISYIKSNYKVLVGADSTVEDLFNSI